MQILKTLRTRHNDYALYKRKEIELNDAYKRARSRILLLISFVKQGIKVEEAKTCMEMELFIYNSLVASFADFLDSLTYEPASAGTSVHFAVEAAIKLEEIAIPYLIDEKDLTNDQK